MERPQSHPLSYEEARVSFGASPDLQTSSFNGSGTSSLHHPGDEALQIVSNGSDHDHMPVSSSYSHPDSDDESTSPSIADQIGADGKKAKRLGFIETLYVMVHTPENEPGIGFGPDGLALEVRNTSFFSTNVLPKHFKHKNVSSFIRQLNNYGFRTIPSSKGVFQTFLHDNFRKDRKDLIRNIARRSNAVVKKKKTLFEQVAEYKQRDIERRQRIEELESTDIQKSQYIGELEARLRTVTEERDSLVVENQRLIMMLSTKDISMRPPPHAASHAHGSVRPGEHNHAPITAHAIGSHAHYVQQPNRHLVPGPTHAHAHHIPQQPRHSPPGANMHQQPSHYHHQPSPQNQAWPNTQHNAHHHQSHPQSLFEPVSGPSRYDPAPTSNENVVDWFTRLI